MKKLLILFLSLIIILSLGGCGVKEKIENKVGEAIGEKLMEDLGGGKVDISGDKIKIKSEDGAEITFNNTEWPKSDLVRNIPVFKNGTIVSVMDSESNALIVLEKVNEKDFISYLGEIKKNFTEDVVEMNADKVITFSAGDGKGFNVQLYFEGENGTLSISASQVGK